MNNEVDISRYLCPGRYADMRAEFLRDCSRGQLSELVRLDELYDHLDAVDEEALEMAEDLWDGMLEECDLSDDELDEYLEQLAERIDEIVCRELIFV